MKSKSKTIQEETNRIEIPLIVKEAPAPVVSTPTPTPVAVKPVNMKTIINESLQAFQLCLLQPGGNKMVLLRPRQTLTVHQSQISNMILNLAKRKIIKII
jgi:hypothetical protein